MLTLLRAMTETLLQMALARLLGRSLYRLTVYARWRSRRGKGVPAWEELFFSEEQRAQLARIRAVERPGSSQPAPTPCPDVLAEHAAVLSLAT